MLSFKKTVVGSFAPAGFALALRSRELICQTCFPGMPPVLDSQNVYSADGAGMLSAAAKNFPYRVYVPNSKERYGRYHRSAHV